MGLSTYHPASNGQAEQFVRTFKHAIRAGEREGRISSILGQYRATKQLRVSFSEYQDDSNEVLAGLPGEVLVVPLYPNSSQNAVTFKS